MYHMQEATLATVISKALLLGSKHPDANYLKNYRVPYNGVTIQMTRVLVFALLTLFKTRNLVVSFMLQLMMLSHVDLQLPLQKELYTTLANYWID